MRFWSYCAVSIAGWAVTLTWLLVGPHFEDSGNLIFGLIALSWLFMNVIVILYDCMLVVCSVWDRSYPFEGSIADHQINTRNPPVFIVPWIVLAVVEWALNQMYPYSKYR